MPRKQNKMKKRTRITASQTSLKAQSLRWDFGEVDAMIVQETIARFCKDAAVSGWKKALYFLSRCTLKFTVNFFSTQIQVGSVDPARDFRSLVKQKSIPFGEGKVLLLLLLLFLTFVLAMSVLLYFIRVLLSTCCFLLFWLWWPCCPPQSVSSSFKGLSSCLATGTRSTTWKVSLVFKLLENSQ